MTQPWEHELLMELEGLQKMVQLYIAFEDLAWKCLEEYGDYMEPRLATVLEKHLDAMHVIISTKFKVTEGGRVYKVNGLIKDYEDVLNEVETLQAGLPAKGEAHVDAQGPGASGPDAPPPTGNKGQGRKPRRKA